MRNIMLLIQRKAFLDNINNHLQKHSGVKTRFIQNYDELCINSLKDVDVILIEVAESGKFDIHYCLNIINNVVKKVGGLKIILMCSDQDMESIKLVLKAKKARIIDDFVFYDVTIDYLVSKILAA